jgi:hypothetical protein
LKQTIRVGKLFGTPSILTDIPREQKDFLEMKAKQQTEITIETHEVTIIRFGTRQTTNVFCTACGTNLKHFSVARAAAVLKISEAAVFRLVEDGQIHSTETAAGALLVCSNSLSALANKQGVKQ